MRKSVALVSLTLAACSTVPVTGSEPAAGGKCSSEGLERYVGQEPTEATGAAILRESGARTLRWIPHGSAVTMDYSEQRVNVKLDPQNRIEAVTCG